jgi:hypothetical protein
MLQLEVLLYDSALRAKPGFIFLVILYKRHGWLLFPELFLISPAGFARRLPSFVVARALTGRAASMREPAWPEAAAQPYPEFFRVCFSKN